MINSVKPTDLDLHGLQRQGISGFSRTRVKCPFLKQASVFKVSEPHKRKTSADFSALSKDLSLKTTF